MIKKAILRKPVEATENSKVMLNSYRSEGSGAGCSGGGGGGNSLCININCHCHKA